MTTPAIIFTPGTRRPGFAQVRITINGETMLMTGDTLTHAATAGLRLFRKILACREEGARIPQARPTYELTM